MSDFIGTWQLPPVAGINQIEVGFVVSRPAISAAPLRVLGSFQIGATIFQKGLMAPGSYLVSTATLYYQDPATFQRQVLVPEPGDIWQILVSDGVLSTGACSPSAASAPMQIAADGLSASAIGPPFTEPQLNPRQSLPPVLNVTLTFLP